MAVPFRAGGDDARRCEVGDPDRRRIPALGGAMLVQHGELVAHGGWIAEQVAGVGMAGDEPERAPLARATDEDRDLRLQRPWVARRLLDGQRPSLEARRARTPHQRQQLQRVLEPRVAVGGDGISQP